jgi:hypothetical protein
VDSIILSDPFRTAFTDLGVTPTVATSYADFDTRLQTGTWDMTVLLQQGSADTTWITPMINYVQGGGRAIVSSWLIANNPSEAQRMAAAFGAQYTGSTNGNPITQTVAHPIWDGISNPFNLFNPGWVTYTTGMTVTSGQSIGRFPNGNDALIVGNQGHTVLNGFLSDTPANATERVQLAENEVHFLLQSPDPQDVYRVTAVPGQFLNLETFTPSDQSGAFQNTLDPLIRLYDADGNLVASDDNSAPDGRNALLSYPVPFFRPNTYFVEVLPSDATPEPTLGEYVLQIQGAAVPEGQPAAASSGVPAGDLGTLDRLFSAWGRVGLGETGFGDHSTATVTAVLVPTGAARQASLDGTALETFLAARRTARALRGAGDAWALDLSVGVEREEGPVKSDR